MPRERAEERVAAAELLQVGLGGVKGELEVSCLRGKRHHCGDRRELQLGKGASNDAWAMYPVPARGPAPLCRVAALCLDPLVVLVS